MSKSTGKSRRRSFSRSRSRERRGRSRSRSRDKKHKKKKSKKSRKRQSSSSEYNSDDSVSSNDSAVMIAKLELKKMDQKRMLREEKQRLKDLETPEEKRLRRLRKKQIKSVKANEKLGWKSDMITYDDDDNPFGDSTLTQTFRWQKKLEKEGIGKINDEDLEDLAKKKIVEQREELEKVKRARLEREKEKAERDEMDELEQRTKESDKFAKWKADEDSFHMKQALLRSSIRIQDGRAKPIDLLAKYISAEDDVDMVDMHEPYTYLNGLTIEDLEDLLVDIKVYQRLEKGCNADYWQDITVIVEDELHKLRKLDSRTGSMYEAAVERREGINKAVSTDVQNVFKGKSVEQLEALQTGIEAKLLQRQEGIDIGYWESLLSQLKAHSARGRLRDKHQIKLKDKLAKLKAEQMEKAVEEGVNEELDPRDAMMARSKERAADKPRSASGSREASEAEEESEDEGEKMVNATIEEYEAGGYSPILLTIDELEKGTVTYMEEEDVAKRNFDQGKALGGKEVKGKATEQERDMENQARKGMGQDEAQFSVESMLEQSYDWSDKYRPRKPRYFNRVHTGFEWNKYNQTHYDFDNPPPKIVQGYKFNIFYPDLINKGEAPTFKMSPTPDGEFVILRISAGPPYEDIAFKIVNKEWEYGYKRGFRCQFHNNIFQLWFHFKRYRYRR